MMRRAKVSVIGRVWLAVFGVWALFLSGALGYPGVIQAVRLHALLDDKQREVEEIEAEIQRFEKDRERLEKNRVAQEREVRKVLGYAAPDEIIFDFAASSQNSRGVN